MSDRDVKTIQYLIYYQYAKIIARRAFGADMYHTIQGLSGDDAGDSEDGQKESYRDGADDAAHNYYHQRLDKGHNALYRAFELFLVKDGYFIADFAELSTFFARAEHLYNAGGDKGAVV